MKSLRLTKNKGLHKHLNKCPKKNIKRKKKLWIHIDSKEQDVQESKKDEPLPKSVVYCHPHDSPKQQSSM